MKKTTYFGNRFKTALGGFRKRASRVSVTRESGASSEFEALENRILLSGITDGTKVLRNITFTDADGDRVNIKVVGGPKNSGFQVPGLGNGFDVDEINLVGLTTASNLVITVTPVRLSSTSNNTTGGSLWSPGYTNIGSIVADDQTNNAGKAVVGATGLRNLNLNAAIVGDINIPDVSIQGSLTLGVGKTAFLDRINTASNANNGANAVGYNPVAGLIDLNDVTAASIGRITVNGIVSSPVDPNNVLTPLTDTNDINGTITVAGDLGGITAVRSILNSNINVGDDLGPINVGVFKANIATGGDLTINLPAGSGGNITAGGHVNLGFQSGQAVTTTTVTAGAGISGIAPSLTDGILVPGLTAKSGFVGQLTNNSVATTAGSGIADITVTGGAAAFDIISANKIGNLTATSYEDSMNVTAGPGGIGNITATAGGNDADFTSGGTVGNIAVTGGSFSGSVNAVGNIGTVTVSTAATAGINGPISSSGGNIGNVLVNITGPTGGQAITASGDLTANGTIGTITLNSASTGADTFAGASVSAGDGIGAILITAATSGAATNGGFFQANNNTDIVGSIPSITVTNSGTGHGITNTDFDGVSIDAVTVTISGPNGGDAIFNADFSANKAVETAIGSGVFNNFGVLGNITVVNNTVSGDGRGIVNSDFFAGNAGKIGNVDVQLSKSTGTGSGIAIDNSAFLATNGAANETIFTSTVGTLTVLSTTRGTAVNDVQIAANAGNDLVSITAQATGASNFDIIADSDGDKIGDAAPTNVTITGINAGGIVNGSSIQGANVGAITVLFSKSTSLGSNTGDGINNLGVTASAGNISAITVGALDNPAGGNGISGLTALATGNIGDVTAFANTGFGIGGGTVLVADSDGSKAGDIGNIAGTSVSGDGIGTTTVTAVNVGTITGKVSGTTGDDGIDGLSVTTLNGGNVGNITGTTAGIGALSQGIVGTSVTAAGGIGNISATTSQAVGNLGGDGINSSFFTALTGNIGTITATAGGDGVDTGTFVAVKGNIGNINANGVSIGLNGGIVNAGGTIGTITATGATVAITGVTFTGGTAIGVTTATGDVSASYTTTDAASSNIGNITGTGTGNQVVTLSTGAAGGVIGNLDFSKLNNGSVLTLSINNAVTLGSVTVASPGGSADLGLAGGTALTSIGAVAVDGKVTLANSLTSVTALTSLNVGSFAVPGSQIVIGNSAAVGTTVGAITIGADQPNIGAIAFGDPSGAAYRFNFDAYGAVSVNATTITPEALATFNPFTPADGNSTQGGFAVILA